MSHLRCHHDAFPILFILIAYDLDERCLESVLRSDLTQSKGDQMMFKVSSLWNTGKINPDRHDGKTKDLAAAVKIMAENQLIQTISEAEPAARHLKTLKVSKGLAYTYAKSELNPF